MSKQFPTSYESVRASMIAFLRQCDPHIEKLRDRQLLKAELNRLQGIGANLGTGLKHTGMSRPMDGLGRIVIPRELRRTFNLDNGSSLVEIFYDEEAKAIYLQAYKMQECAICNSPDDLTKIDMGLGKTKCVCEECISRIFEGEKS